MLLNAALSTCPKTWCYFSLRISTVKLRDRVLVLIGRAYRSIRLANLVTLLGQSETEVKQSKSQNGKGIHCAGDSNPPRVHCAEGLKST